MALCSKMSSCLLILLILNSTHFNQMANGRPEPNSLEFTKRGDRNQKMMMRGLIGSSPPRCERVRCHSCGHCEAIQVPTNPQTKLHSPSSSSSSEIVNLDYTRGEDTTNYKPMSWKCKCEKADQALWKRIETNNNGSSVSSGLSGTSGSKHIFEW